MRSIGILYLIVGISAATAAPSSNRATTDQRDEIARTAYFDCVLAKASELRSKPISIENALELSVARCLPQRDYFTFELIKSMRGNEAAYGLDPLMVPLDVRDAYEREMLRDIRKQLADVRAMKLKETQNASHK